MRALGGEVRKVKWIGRNGAPDRLIMIYPAGTIWVELKATGKHLEPHQAREHRRMQRQGMIVATLDSTEKVDFLLNDRVERCRA